MINDKTGGQNWWPAGFFEIPSIKNGTLSVWTWFITNILDLLIIITNYDKSLPSCEAVPFLLWLCNKMWQINEICQTSIWPGPWPWLSVKPDICQPFSVNSDNLLISESTIMFHWKKTHSSFPSTQFSLGYLLKNPSSSILSKDLDPRVKGVCGGDYPYPLHIKQNIYRDLNTLVVLVVV